MLEDVLEILLERNSGRWEGTSKQILEMMEAVSPGSGYDAQKLGYELPTLQGIKAEKKTIRGCRLWVITLHPDSGSLHPEEETPHPTLHPENEGAGSEQQGAGLPENGVQALDDSNSTNLVQVFFEQQKSVDARREVSRALHVLHPQEPFEIRCLNPVRAGVFDDLEKATKAVLAANGKHKGIYFTLNPVTRPVTNRLEKTGETTSAKQIARRTWLLLDIEGRRPNTKENATNEEVSEAVKTGQAIMATVQNARPLVLCSGNGCHLLYRVDLPNTDEMTVLVNKALKGLAALYDSPGATVDSKVSDPSRISKLPGTLTRKGEHTEERPQRHAFVLDWEVTGTLPRTQLEEWAAKAPADTATATKSVANESTRKGPKVKMDGLGRATLWLEKRAPCVEGQGGDEQLYRTCCELVTGFLLDEEEALEALQSGWNDRCSPPWSEGELRAKVRNAQKNSHQAVGAKLAQAPPGKTEWTEEEIDRDEKLNSYAWTDLGNARALIHLYGERLRWCTTSKRWLVWTETHWSEDGKNKALAWTNKTALARLAACEALEDTETQEKAQKYFRAQQNTKNRNAVLEQVKAWVPNVLTTDELDRDAWLLNCKNGTFNLRNQRLFPHAQADLITRCIDVDLDESAECPRWLAFLNRVMDGNQDLISYLQRAAGYSLTGDTREQCLFLCYGGGKNGKSVFLETLGTILAGYSVQSPAATFAAGDKDKIPNDVARLKGSRLVRCVETDEKLVFNEGLVKSMTGSDTLTARFMRAEWFEFKPTFKLWFATNHKPSIHGSDNSIWRRMRLIPWTVQIPPEERDKQLQDKLLQEAPGILAWAIRGFKAWLEGGLQEPEIIERETNEYREEMDAIGQWVQECCDEGPLLRDTTSILYKYFSTWAKEKGIWSGNEIHFGRRLGAKGFGSVKGSGGIRYRTGLRVNLRTRKDEDYVEPNPQLDKEVSEAIEGFKL